MGSVHTNRSERGRSTKRSHGRKGVQKKLPEVGDVNLLRYFRDITDYPLLDFEDEKVLSRRIVDLQVEQWRTCLEHPPVAAVVARMIRTHHPQLACRMAFVKRAYTGWQRNRGRFTTAEYERYMKRVDALAPELKRADQDRELLDRISSWILAQPRTGDDEPCIRASRALTQIQQQLGRLHSEDRGLRERFVTSNLRLVIAVAKKQNRGKLSLSDLIQEGNIGLMKAVQRFDPDTGYRFSTYAIWWIRHAITRALADKSRTVRLPVHLVEASKKLQRARSRFFTMNGREPTDQELARELDISPLKLRRLLRQSTDPAYSLDRELSDDGPTRFIDSVPDEEDSPLDQICNMSWCQDLRCVIDQLPDIEAQILRWRYGLGRDDELTLKQIGERYQLSRERIRQLQQQALWRMRQSIKGLY